LQNMHRMTRDGGYVVFTCASRGRLEHGTTRTTPEESPGSQSYKWDYYKNLREKDVREITDALPFHFTYFLYNPYSKDLYFVGKKGNAPSAKAGFDSENQKDDFVQAVRPAFQASPDAGIKNWGIVRYCIELAYSAPLETAARLLPDKQFRDFAHIYQECRLSFMRSVRNVHAEITGQKTTPLLNPKSSKRQHKL
jgi:hypothetical protein